MEKTKISNKPTLSFGTRLGYGMGGMFTYSFYNSFLAYSTLFFLTNVAGFPTVVAATMYSTIQLLKIISMTFSGVVIDSTNLRFGKFRSWIMVGTTGIFLTTGTMFLDWGWTGPAYAVVFVGLYALSNFSYNLNWASTRSIVGPMSTNSADSIGLTSMAQICGTVSGVTYGLVSAGLMAFFERVSKVPYALAGYFYTGIIVLGSLLMLKITKPYDVPKQAVPEENGKKPEKVSFLEMLKSLKGQGLVFFIATTVGNIQGGFFTSLLVYYTTYVLQDPKALGLAVTVSSVGGFIGGLFAPSICTKISKKWAYILSHVLTAVLYFAMYLFGDTAITFLAIRFLIGLCGSLSGAAMPAMGNDLADYNEMNGASRARAFVQSSIGASIRIGSLVSNSISSFGLAALGYVAGTTPTPEILAGITLLMAMGPAIVNALCCVLMLFYKIDEKKLDEYRRKKAEEKAAAAANVQ